MVEIVPLNPKKSKTKKQESDVFHEVSMDSNGLFEETTKEEREAAEKSLHRMPENKPEPCDSSVQEQYKTSVEPNNIKPQNTERQMQPVVAPQNAVVQDSQNGTMNPVFRQHEERQERYYHKYCPIPFDDSTGCVTYIVKANVKAEDRITMSEYAMLSRKLRGETKKDSVDIAAMYINSVDDYGTKYKLSIDYMNADIIRHKKNVFVDKEDCISNRLVEVLKQNGICCFFTEEDKRISL